MKKIFKMFSVTKDYIWGGERLTKKYNKGTGGIVAESWELSCHPEGESLMEGGKSFAQYIKENPEVLGSDRASDEFPILIKFIDAAKDLSVQVHPDNDRARTLENDKGKTEMWYIVDAEKNSKIVYGVAQDTDTKTLKEAILENKVESLLDIIPSKKGDSFFVEAGTIHAIGAGNLVLEIQQNSNVTYRLYDYGRLGKDGKPRELHVEKGVVCANTLKTELRKTPLCSDGARLLGSCEYFQVKEYKITKKQVLCADEKSYNAVVVTQGSAVLEYEGGHENIIAGDTYFIPAGLGEYTINGKATVIVTRNSPRYFVGIDLGGTNIAAAVVDEYGIIYGRAKRKTMAPRHYSEIFDDMAECARESALMSGIPFKDIDAVGIGCPGAISKNTGVVEFSNNLEFYNAPIVEYMQKALSKTIYIENDANAAAWGEYLAGSGKGCGSMVMITLGTGVGGGIIENGRLLVGAWGKGAEIGHTVIAAGGEKCNCGRRGCLEAYASATALIRQTKAAMKKDKSSQMWKVCGGRLSNVDGKTAFLAKDATAKAVVRNYLNYLTEGVVNITNLLQPETICIGGGVSHEGEKILKPIRRGIAEKSFARFGAEQTTVRLASLGNDAGIIGAALLWKNK